jgi:hypothetical protein
MRIYSYAYSLFFFIISVDFTLRAGKTLFTLMSVFPQFFLAFMCGNLSKFAFSSAGHLTLLYYGIKNGSSHSHTGKNQCGYDYAIWVKKGQ